MKALKKFIDADGRTVRVGQDVSGLYEQQTLSHYLHLGMVAEPELPALDPNRKGGEVNPLPLADSQADLAGLPRPDEVKPAEPGEVKQSEAEEQPEQRPQRRHKAG